MRTFTKHAFASLALCALLLCETQSFAFHGTTHRSTSSHLMTAKTENEFSADSRRTFFYQSASTVAAAVLGTMTSNFAMLPASAAVSGANKVNAKLSGFGLPTMAKVPDGFSPVLEIYGKGKNRFPLLVTFAHPLSWVLTLPSNNVNGEDGTVQAGDYGKGDTATFFVYENAGHVDDITSQPKTFYEDTLQKAIGQRGSNMYQNFKVTKLEPFTTSDGQKYMLADFKYQLLTGAGFEVDRKGVASITSEGKAVELLWAASTAIRYKKTEQTLRDIVATFRCYAEGINFSDELFVYDA